MGGGCDASHGRPLILELIAKHGFAQGCALNAFFVLGCGSRNIGGGVGME
jgi:putative component of membrane protein insertase Oxa1/YidC/SpoIIIJ protein YidD